MNSKKIIMLGTTPDGKGGISTVVRSYQESGIMKRLGIDYYPIHHDGSNEEKILFYLSGLMNILCKLSQYEVVHIHTASWWSFRRKLIVVLIGKLFRKKIIIHIHGAKFNVFYERTCALEKTIIRYGLSLADRVVVLSKEWKKKLMEVCEPGKIVILPNCVTCAKSVDVDKKRNCPKTILFLGELGARKGVYDLVEAVRILASNGYNIQFLICGNGDLEGVRRKVEQLGLREFVSVPGWVDGERKEALLREAYIYVLPSYHEGLPMSILEAMATGTPVISTPVGGIPGLVKDWYNGFLVPPGKPEILAKRLEELLENEKLWIRMSANALGTIKKHFSIEETERQLFSLYKGIRNG